MCATIGTGEDRRVRLIAMLAGALVLTLALASGCGPKYPNCATDGHCKTKGEYCVDKKCVQCREASHCANAATDPCVLCDKGACGRKPSCCANNLDCPSGKKCSEAKCVAECSSDQDCPAGKTCNEESACIAEVAGCTGDGDCSGGLTCHNGICVNADGECQIVTVRFDFNESLLTSDAQDAIGANYKCIKKNKMSRRIRLEGHCDERGTDAYNLELGNRRARAVRKYLRQIAPKMKVQTVSYGKTRPICESQNESCWSQNRRVVFKFRK